MREFNALVGYPEPKTPRDVGPDIRTIHNRITASYRGKELYDGDRNNGYGGFTYDGRWVPIAKFMAQEYGLDRTSAVLQLNCEKGFLLHDFQELFPGITVRGVEISDYVIEQAMPSVRASIHRGPWWTPLPFPDHAFDVVVAIGVVYALTLSDAIVCLKEIQRVGKGKSFVTLAAYDTEEGKRLFEWWTLLGVTVLRKDEWVEVLTHVGYTGDYKFTTAQSLKLRLRQQEAAVR
jgi:hypothetical protein